MELENGIKSNDEMCPRLNKIERKLNFHLDDWGEIIMGEGEEEETMHQNIFLMRRSKFFGGGGLLDP